MIKITKTKDIFRDNYRFSVVPAYTILCTCKKVFMDGTAVNIINKLKEAGLLDKDFELVCCMCYAERNGDNKK